MRALPWMEADRKMEPRRRPRAPYRGWVELTLPGERLRAEGRDLSMDGLGLELTGAAPLLDQRLVFEFALPGISLPLELRGRVAWVDARAGRAGIRFEGVDPGLSDLLSNFVAGRL